MQRTCCTNCTLRGGICINVSNSKSYKRICWWKSYTSSRSPYEGSLGRLLNMRNDSVSRHMRVSESGGVKWKRTSDSLTLLKRTRPNSTSRLEMSCSPPWLYREANRWQRRTPPAPAFSPPWSQGCCYTRLRCGAMMRLKANLVPSFWRASSTSYVALLYISQWRCREQVAGLSVLKKLFEAGEKLSLNVLIPKSNEGHRRRKAYLIPSPSSSRRTDWER